MAGGAELRAFLAACHEGPADLEAWARGWSEPLARRARFAHGTVIGLADVEAHQHSLLESSSASGGVVQAIGRRLERFGGYDLAFRRPFRVARGSRWFASLGGMPALLPGWQELFGLTVWSDKRVTLVVSGPVKDAGSVDHSSLYRLQRHLAGAALQRADQIRVGDFVVSPERGVVHAPQGANWVTERTVLERVAALEMGDLDGESEAEAAQAIWDELWRGGYAVHTMVDRDGRRYVVLRAQGAGKKPALTAAERAVCALALREASLKSIAAHLGITVATASTHLTRALGKLGLSHRAELSKLVGP